MRELHFKYQETNDPGLVLEDKTSAAPSTSHTVEAAKREISRFSFAKVIVLMQLKVKNKIETNNLKPRHPNKQYIETTF